jgi:hypothetical protein
MRLATREMVESVRSPVVRCPEVLPDQTGIVERGGLRTTAKSLFVAQRHIFCHREKIERKIKMLPLQDFRTSGRPDLRTLLHARFRRRFASQRAMNRTDIAEHAIEFLGRNHIRAVAKGFFPIIVCF